MEDPWAKPKLPLTDLRILRKPLKNSMELNIKDSFFKSSTSLSKNQMIRKTTRNPLTEISRYKNNKNLMQLMEQDPREEKREVIEEMIEKAATVIRKTSNRI